MKTTRTIHRRHFLQTSALAACCGPAISASAPRRQVNVALVGLGGRSQTLLKECLQYGGNVVALCDVDANQLTAPAKLVGAPRLYEDYRRLLREARDIDAAVIATPDHWHAPLCRAFMEAGKHVYCEKPLTRTIGEARDLRALARRSRVVTQLGNQGSAHATLRRSVELVKAGVLGQVREVHTWIQLKNQPDAPDTIGEDSIPTGFNWDFWLGPSPLRPYKSGLYHPSKWRQWYDFGSGRLGDFGCHGFNLPMRALDLGYPERVEIEAPQTSADRYYNGSNARLHFPTRGRLAPVTVHWHDGSESVPQSALQDVLVTYRKMPFSGCLLVGERGVIFATIWGENAVIKLKDEARLRGVLDHEATKSVPVTLPRTDNHMNEWLQACRGNGKVYSDFDVGGLLTEIAISGALALRVGRHIAWNGDKMEVPDAAHAKRFIAAEYRKKWL